MHYDIFKPISQGEHRADDEENDRLGEVANILLRSSAEDEGKFRSWQTYGRSIYDEQNLIEQFIERTGCWLPLDGLFALGVPGPSGSENDTYVDKTGCIVYKMNNLIHSGSYFRLFHRLLLHNYLFPQTAYTLVGFTGYKGRTLYPLLAQRYVKNAVPATPFEINEYMGQLGFSVKAEWTYENTDYVISDMKPKNVLKDSDGDIFVIDAEISAK